MTGRVVFLIRLKPGMQAEFLQAYESIRHLVARGVPGHIVDQVCQFPDDPDRWMITSEWESLEDFLAWERTEEHRELARPLRECMAEATSLKYVVREETRGMNRPARDRQAAVRALVRMAVSQDRHGEFRRAWHDVAERAQLVPGIVRQMLLRDSEDPAAFVIASDWESDKAFQAFERSDEQDDLTAPLRELRQSAHQQVYEIVDSVEP
jgi:heme-degrading monooxygenase HmoA